MGRLTQRLGLKMYRPRLLHGVLVDDPDRRLHSCEVVLNDKRQGNDIVDKITRSDETHFKLSDVVNRHNWVYYSTKNHRLTIEGHLNQVVIRVWVGLSCKGVLRTFFPHTSVTHDLHLNRLMDTVNLT